MRLTAIQNVFGKEAASVGQGNGFKNKWIKKDGSDIVLLQTEEPKDLNRELLQGIKDTQSLDDAKMLAQLKKKKLVTVTKVITYTITKGPKYAKEIPVEHTDLTVELLATTRGRLQTSSHTILLRSAQTRSLAHYIL